MNNQSPNGDSPSCCEGLTPEAETSKTIPLETYENLVRLYRSAIRLCGSFHDLQDRFNPFRLQQVFNEIQATEDVLTDLNHGKNPVFHLDPVSNVCATAALFADPKE